jgi:hypothetical protein
MKKKTFSGDFNQHCPSHIGLEKKKKDELYKYFSENIFSPVWPSQNCLIT